MTWVEEERRVAGGRWQVAWQRWWFSISCQQQSLDVWTPAIQDRHFPILALQNRERASPSTEFNYDKSHQVTSFHTHIHVHPLSCPPISSSETLCLTCSDTLMLTYPVSQSKATVCNVNNIQVIKKWIGFTGTGLRRGSNWFCRVLATLQHQQLSGVPGPNTLLRSSAVNQPYTFLPSPSPTSWVTHTPTHPCTPTCTHEERLELKLQDSPERNLRDWTLVEAEIQIVNQSDSVSLRSPHHHLIRRPPMSLKFPVRLAAPCKECHEHCTGFVDHIRYDHVLPAPSALNFLVNHYHFFKKEALFFR